MVILNWGLLKKGLLKKGHLLHLGHHWPRRLRALAFGCECNSAILPNCRCRRRARSDAPGGRLTARSSSASHLTLFEQAPCLKKPPFPGTVASILLLLTLGCFGCTSTTRLLMTADLPKNQTNYKKLPVYFQEPPRKSRPLALIAVARDGENATWAVEILKMEAAVLGADALADVEMNYSSGIFPTLRVQGLAVKYVP